MTEEIYVISGVGEGTTSLALSPGRHLRGRHLHSSYGDDLHTFRAETVLLGQAASTRLSCPARGSYFIPPHPAALGLLTIISHRNQTYAGQNARMHTGIQKLSLPQPVSGAYGGANALWRRKWRFRQKRLNYTLVGNPRRPAFL
jgi:hypothetical protein